MSARGDWSRARFALRLSALIAPALLASLCALGADAHGTARLARAAVPLIVVLFAVMLAALLVRACEASDRRAVADALDVLTPSGRALAWLAGAAVVGSIGLGWASLAVVGVLGLVSVALLVTWTALAAAGEETWRALGVTSRVVPAAPVEGDALVEQLTVSGVRIPPGFRLFVRGGLGSVESRYAVGGEASRAELGLSAPLGPARRGEHAIAPRELWLQDVFGVSRTRIVRAGAGRLVVLPRPLRVERSPSLERLARGDDDDTVPASRLPSEGCFRLREYAPGDDARRIHWPRSLMAQALIVRQPDEIPREHPSLRLILDTQLIGVEGLATPATHQLLDALVRVWLGVARTLARDGVRVTMVTAAPPPSPSSSSSSSSPSLNPSTASRASDASRGADGSGFRVVERPMLDAAAAAALQLGARVRWQGALSLSSLLDVNAVNLIVSARPRPLDGEASASWIVVPELAWTEAEVELPVPSPTRLTFPAGAAENGLAQRRAERARVIRRRRDGLIFDRLLALRASQLAPGTLLAHPHGDRVLLEAVS